MILYCCYVCRTFLDANNGPWNFVVEWKDRPKVVKINFTVNEINRKEEEEEEKKRFFLFII